MEQEHEPNVPMIFIWSPESGAPIFLAIATDEDRARGAVMNHPDIAPLLAGEYLALLTSPPTQVISPEEGWAVVVNWKAEDRIEI